jgi:hypothetical protein
MCPKSGDCRSMMAARVRYPIPQRTFKYVATVQSVTDETCQSTKSLAIVG